MRLSAVSLLVLSMLPILRDSGAKEPEKPVRQSVIEVPFNAQSHLIQTRGGFLPRPRRSTYQSTIPLQVRMPFDRSFSDADISYIIREFDKRKITSVYDSVGKAQVYSRIANKFHVRHSGEEVVALFTNFQCPEIIGDEKELDKAAEKINEFCDLVNKDQTVTIPPYRLIEAFNTLKHYKLFDSAKSPSEVAGVIRYFNEKIVKSAAADLPLFLNHFLSTYHVSGINGYKEKADAIGKLAEVFRPYTNHPENMQKLLNGLAWDEYIDGMGEKSSEEIAESILEKVKQYKFSPFISVMFARNGVDPKYANEYLEKAKEKNPDDLALGQLILFKVPLEFYLDHASRNDYKSHDPSVVIHDFNEIKIKELLKTSGVKDLDKAMEEMKRMNTHFGMAFPENYVDSYFIVKSMENYEEEIPKIKNIILFLLPGYKPGNDPSTRVDSAFMFTAFSIKKLDELGFKPIIFTCEKDYDVERIANEVSGNYNCNDGTEWPLKAIVVAGHGNGDGFFTDDVPYNPGFNEKKHSSSVFDTKDIGIFESIGHCFEPDSPVALIFCSCSAASPYAKPKNFLTFASEELPPNVIIQGPEVPTSIYDAQRAGELPLFIFDGWTSTRGKRVAPLIIGDKK